MTETITPPPPRVVQRQLRHRTSPLRNLSPWQLGVAGLSLIAPSVALFAIFARAFGFFTTEEMIELALGAGENPGTFTFAALFLASPVQWLTGRSQVRIRKFLGIVFYGLAVNNFAMFVVEQRVDGTGVLAEIGGSPMILAGFTAFLLATPLFLTSSRWSQRFLGMRRWRLLHKLTYVVAVALVAHVLMVPDAGPDTVLLALGFAARVPSIRRRLQARGRRR